MSLQLLVFDFDGTIISTTDHHIRPYYWHLIKYLKYHKIRIGIWTAASIEWIKLHLDESHLHSFDFIWDKEYIKYENESVIKPLKSLYRSKCNPIKSNKRNTLIIDDTPSTYKYNRRNAIPIKYFETNRDTKDDYFLYLIILLELIKNNIRKIHIIGIQKLKTIRIH